MKTGVCNALPFLYEKFSTGHTPINKEAVAVVKGISRQVIVVHSPDQKLFDQAIFILKADAVGKEGVTDEMLLKAANKLINSPPKGKKRNSAALGVVWACAGALATGFAWLLTVLI